MKKKNKLLGRFRRPAPAAIRREAAKGHFVPKPLIERGLRGIVPVYGTLSVPSAPSMPLAYPPIKTYIGSFHYRLIFDLLLPIQYLMN